MSIFYQFLLILVIIIALPYFLFMSIVEKHGFLERLGLWKFKPDDRKVIWFHAASMGELKVINSVLPQLLKFNPYLRIVISTMTKTGKTRALKLFDPIEVYYVPLDLKPFISNVLNRIKPSLLVLVETEIWPVLIRQASKQGTRVAVVNGRLSRKSMKLYKIFSGLFKPVVGDFDIVMAQTDQYAERFKRMGADPDAVLTMGNIKFDQVLDQNPKALDNSLDKYINRHDRFIFIAGSIWPNEFKAIITAVMNLREKHPELRVMLAPRHLKNLPRLEEELNSNGMPYVKRSNINSEVADVELMVLDTMGELSGLYRYGDLAFVGGSFVNIGGHDPLEPASAGCPVCFGPHMENSDQFLDILLDSGGAHLVDTGEKLQGLLERLLDDRSLSKELGFKARQAVLDHSGVSEDIAAKLSEMI